MEDAPQVTVSFLLHRPTLLLIPRVYLFVIWRRNGSRATILDSLRVWISSIIVLLSGFVSGYRSHWASSKTALQAVHGLAFDCLLTSSSAISHFFFLHSPMLHHRAECCQECFIHALPVDGLISFFRSCLQRGLGSVSIPLLLILVAGCYFCTTYHNFNYTYVFIYIFYVPLPLDCKLHQARVSIALLVAEWQECTI